MLFLLLLSIYGRKVGINVIGWIWGVTGINNEKFCVCLVYCVLIFYLSNILVTFLIFPTLHSYMSFRVVL